MYKTKTEFGYRVQLTVRKSNSLNSPRSGQQKFSRNTSSVLDALWMYEIAILIHDAPRDLNTLISCGNFRGFLQEYGVSGLVVLYTVFVSR